MAAVRLLRRTALAGTDPSAVWTVVADPSRVAEWAPVREAGWIGTEMPGDGQVVFLERRFLGPLRFRIVAWDAGHLVRLVLEERTLVHEGRLAVIVAGSPGDTTFELRFTAEVPRWLAPLARLRVRWLLWRSVRGLERTLVARA